MKAHAHGSTHRLILSQFTAGPDPQKRRDLFAELARCRACAGLYNRFQFLEAGLCGNFVEPTRFALERVETVVLEKISEAPLPESRTKPAGRWAWISVPALAGILALVIVLFVSGPAAHRVAIPADAALVPVTLTARGAAPAEASQVGVRIFSVAAAGATVQERPVLDLGDVVTFTYTNVSSRVKYLALFGVQADGEVRWYYPGYQGTQSISIGSEKVDEPLGEGIRLSVNHRPGWLRIVAMFSDEPLDVGLLESAVQNMLVEPRALRSLEPLSLAGRYVLQHSLLVQIGPMPAGEGGESK